jgi:peptide/nickel transport system substrate-binding protein
VTPSGARVLRIGLPFRPSGIDPHVNSAELAYRIFANVFDPLVWRTKSGAFLPRVAEHWDIAADGLTYRFQLRRDVSFHDGTPLTAAAVQASLDRIADPGTCSQMARHLLGPYARCDVLGEHDLVVRLQQPFAPFLDALSQAWLAPASPSAVTSLGARFAQMPVGAGAFRIVPSDREDELVLEQNPRYYRDPPLLDGIVFVFIPDRDERVAALRARTIDGCYEFFPGDLELIQGDVDLVFRVDPVPGVPLGLMLNTRSAPTSEIEVRRAIANALDLPEILRRVFRAHVTPATGVLASTTPCYERVVEGTPTADVAGAQALLDAAGWRTGADGVRTRGGERLKLVFCALPNADKPHMGAEVARQLRGIGCEVEVRLLKIADWLAAGDAGMHHIIPEGKFSYEPDVLETMFHSRHIGHGFAWSHCRDDTLDALLSEAIRGSDLERRRALYSEIQRRIAELALFVPVHENFAVTVLGRRVHGYDVDLRGYPLVNDVTLEPTAAA